MAIAYTASELRKQLTSPQNVKENPFAILQSLSVLINQQTYEDIGRDLLLRALEWRESFGACSIVLDSLSRLSGLYPHIDVNSLGAKETIAYEYHRPEFLKDIVFHREQAEVYRRLLAGDSVILSAPTSFGKSRVIDAIIATGRHQNIVVVVPTLALIDETRRRLSQFSDQYKVITHIAQTISDKNIFVLTAERAVSFEFLPKVDFFVIDEFYKIGAMDEDQSRTIALNEAFYRLHKDGGQFYLLGPNIQRIPEGLERRFRCFFYRTKFSTVAVDTVEVPGRGKDIARLLEVLKTLDEPTLVYCSSPAKVNEVARAMIEAGITSPSSTMTPASEWIGKTYHKDWVFGTGLINGIGVHHGRLPRSLAQFVVRAFNEEQIRFLICTSTLIEGVNTKAKNVLIWDNTIGNNRPLDFFTFNNIRGRSGRMFQHFVGRVFLFDSPPQELLPFVDFPLFTQDESTPTSLLLQIDDKDLTPKSQDRVKKYANQNALSLNVLRSNHSIEPDRQIALAEHIDVNAKAIWPKLAWTGFPNYEQLKFACELLWDKLVDSSRRHGVFSGTQLAFKTFQLMQTKSVAKRVKSELQPGRYAAKSPDEAVERVLQFERNWAGFELPKLFRALSSIQKEVLSRSGLPFGDYTAFAAQAESLFRVSVVAALDEYGIPIEVGEKLAVFLKSKDDLDIALSELKRLDASALKLSAFELELVENARKYM